MTWPLFHRILNATGFVSLVFLLLETHLSGSNFLTINAIVIILSYLITFSVSNKNISTIQIFGLSTLILCGLAPRFEYLFRYTYHYPSEDLFNYYGEASLYTLVGIIITVGTWKFPHSNRSKIEVNRQTKVSFLRLLTLSIFSCLLMAFYNSFDIYSILYRSAYDNLSVNLGSSLRLIYKFVIFPMPAICLIIYLTSCRRTFTRTLILVLLFFVFNSPISMSRWLAAAIYGSILVILMPNFINKKNLFSIVLVIGLIFVFPLLDFFRHGLSGDLNLFNFKWVIAGHFDSFQNFALLLMHGELSYGYQLLGAVFFFVPRSIWHDKPIATGTQLARDMGFESDNIAMNYFGEAYANFGLLGICMFAFFLGYLLKKIDFLRANSFSKFGDTINRFFMIYFIWVFFLIRGDLMNGISQIVGLSGCILIVTAIVKVRKSSI